MNDWISVKDNLPADLTYVLTWFNGLFKEFKISFHNKGYFYPNDISDEDITKWITHWMPLPPTPEQYETTRCEHSGIEWNKDGEVVGVNPQFKWKYIR